MCIHTLLSIKSEWNFVLFWMSSAARWTRKCVKFNKFTDSYALFVYIAQARSAFSSFHNYTKEETVDRFFVRFVRMLSETRSELIFFGIYFSRVYLFIRPFLLLFVNLFALAYVSFMFVGFPKCLVILYILSMRIHVFFNIYSIYFHALWQHQPNWSILFHYIRYKCWKKNSVKFRKIDMNWRWFLAFVYFCNDFQTLFLLSLMFLFN